MILYLYGDLAIYCTAIAKSLRDVTCTDNAGTAISIIPYRFPVFLYTEKRYGIMALQYLCVFVELSSAAKWTRNGQNMYWYENSPILN